MTASPDNLYLGPDQVRELRDLLREIPELAADLTDSIAKRTRLGGGVKRWQPRAAAQPLPYDPAAAAAADHLHAILVSWVRLVCEHRAIEYDGAAATGGLAVWLDRYVIAVAMTPGAEQALGELEDAVRAANRIVCPPVAAIELDEAGIAAARRTRLNASGIAALAKELGPEFRGLNVRRIQTLREAGRVGPVPGPWAPDWPEQFLVGEVLDAHLVHPLRGRRSAGKCAGGGPPVAGIAGRAG
jgi:hypothetical protein